MLRRVSAAGLLVAKFGMHQMLSRWESFRPSSSAVALVISVRAAVIRA